MYALKMLRFKNSACMTKKLKTNYEKIKTKK